MLRGPGTASSATSNSPVLEEGADGVRLMTAHAAKGLEFPVVVLADMTANIARAEPGLYLDAANGLAASKILGLSPWELQDHAELELARDRAEGVRLAYVAATRARDLLVVPAVGTGPWEGGWVSPLNPAIYPPRHAYSASRPAPGCPDFSGKSTVLTAPQTMAGPVHTAVRPGLHRPEAGEHEVVWWDPRALELAVEGHYGLRQEQILGRDASGEQAAAGLARYEAWRAERDRRLEAGATPRFDVATVTDLAQGEVGFEAEVDLEVLPRDADRPAGVRFGTLVHTVLRDVDFAAGEEAVRALAEMHGRMLDATGDEVEAATASAVAALAHPLLRRAAAAERLHREAPFLLDRGGGSIVEGTVDLAFLEVGVWTVVDFKTDADLDAQQERYRRQVAWYVYAMKAMTGQEARGVLLGV